MYRSLLFPHQLEIAVAQHRVATSVRALDPVEVYPRREPSGICGQQCERQKSECRRRQRDAGANCFCNDSQSVILDKVSNERNRPPGYVLRSDAVGLVDGELNQLVLTLEQTQGLILRQVDQRCNCDLKT